MKRLLSPSLKCGLLENPDSGMTLRASCCSVDILGAAFMVAVPKEKNGTACAVVRRVK